MEDIEIFERMGLALAIGAGVGVERHLCERTKRREPLSHCTLL
jgi:hypothetical protein